MLTIDTDFSDRLARSLHTKMNLDQQIQLLIENAPQDGQTPKIVAAIAPALKLLSQRLRHESYYIVQNLDGRWLTTTLSNRAQPGVEKVVIYAFPTLSDATTGPLTPQTGSCVAAKFPVTHILFQMMALNSVDSLVFFETPNELTKAIEVSRQDIQNLVQNQLRKQLGIPEPKSGSIPPNLA